MSTSKSFSSILRPGILSMAICGMSHGDLVSSKRQVILLTRVYGVLVLVLSWANVLRFIPILAEIQEFNGDNLVAVFILIMLFVSALNYTHSFRIFANKERLTTLAEQWTVYTSAYDGKCLSGLHRYVVADIVSSWLLIVLFEALFVYNITISPEGLSILTYPVQTTDELFFAARVAWSFTLPFVVSAFFLIDAFVFSLCYTLYKSLKSFNNKLKTEASLGDVFDIGKFKHQHQQLCSLSDLTDNVVSCYIFMKYLFGTTMVLLLFYVVIWFPDTRDSVGMPTIITCLILCTLGVVSNSTIGVMVNHEAHASWEVIRDIDIMTMTQEDKMTMLMWSQVLSGPPIGVTALKMFTVDKPAVLSLVTAFATYLIVLVQFQQSAPVHGQPVANTSQSPNPCNGTVSL